MRKAEDNGASVLSAECPVSRVPVLQFLNFQDDTPPTQTQTRHGIASHPICSGTTSRSSNPSNFQFPESRSRRKSQSSLEAHHHCHNGKLKPPTYLEANTHHVADTMVQQLQLDCTAAVVVFAQDAADVRAATDCIPWQEVCELGLPRRKCRGIDSGRRIRSRYVKNDIAV